MASTANASLLNCNHVNVMPKSSDSIHLDGAWYFRANIDISKSQSTSQAVGTVSLENSYRRTGLLVRVHQLKLSSAIEGSVGELERIIANVKNEMSSGKIKESEIQAYNELLAAVETTYGPEIQAIRKYATRAERYALGDSDDGPDAILFRFYDAKNRVVGTVSMIGWGLLGVCR
jgi:hypothetical protein